MSRIKMGITIALIGLLTGCANNAYLTDEENIPVDQRRHYTGRCVIDRAKDREF